MTVPTYQEFLTCAITPFPTSEIIYVSEKDRRYSIWWRYLGRLVTY